MCYPCPRTPVYLLSGLNRVREGEEMNDEELVYMPQRTLGLIMNGVS